MELEELHRAMEAILFASGERIDIQRFADVFELDPDEIEKAADGGNSSPSPSAGKDAAAVPQW